MGAPPECFFGGRLPLAAPPFVPGTITLGAINWRRYEEADGNNPSTETVEEATERQLYPMTNILLFTNYKHIEQPYRLQHRLLNAGVVRIAVVSNT